MQVTILGKHWRLRLLPKNTRRNHYGRCEHPGNGSKTIVVETGHDDRTELATLLHEFMHAGLWALDEEPVDQWSEDVAKILHKLGWRKSET